MSDTEGFTFTWRIENFSMCPQKSGEYLVSPVFIVDMLEKTKWRMQLYPSGHKTENFVSCFLQCTDIPRYTSDVTLAFKIIVFCADDMKHEICSETKQTFGHKAGWGWDKIISREYLLAHKEEYLPNDVLTIICNMWRIDDHENTEDDVQDITICGSQDIFETFLAADMFSNATRDNLLDFRPHFGSNRGSTRTNIKVRKRVVSWPIKNYSSLRINQQLSIPLISTLVGVPSFALTFYLSGSSNEDKCAQIEIRRKSTECSGQVLVSCKISVLNTLKNNQYFVEAKHLFEPDATNDVFKFPSFIKESKLRDDKYFETFHDVLFLRIELSFSRLGDISHIEDVDVIPHADQNLNFSNIPNPFENEFENFYKDGEFSDVTLRVGDRVFKAHKLILSARSSFFSSLFNSEAKDNMKIVDITDFSPDIVNQMLTFMYTDTLEDLKPKDAIELYSAAYTYKVLPLIMRCRAVFKSVLIVSNACDALKLADAHQDDDLKDTAHEFISTHLREIFQSPEWKYFMKCNSSLAADVMYRMLTENTE